MAAAARLTSTMAVCRLEIPSDAPGATTLCFLHQQNTSASHCAKARAIQRERYMFSLSLSWTFTAKYDLQRANRVRVEVSIFDGWAERLAYNVINIVFDMCSNL